MYVCMHTCRTVYLEGLMLILCFHILCVSCVYLCVHVYSMHIDFVFSGIHVHLYISMFFFHDQRINSAHDMWQTEACSPQPFSAYLCVGLSKCNTHTCIHKHTEYTTSESHENLGTCRGRCEAQTLNNSSFPLRPWTSDFLASCQLHDYGHIQGIFISTSNHKEIAVQTPAPRPTRILPMAQTDESQNQSVHVHAVHSWKPTCLFALETAHPVPPHLHWRAVTDTHTHDSL